MASSGHQSISADDVIAAMRLEVQSALTDSQLGGDTDGRLRFRWAVNVGSIQSVPPFLDVGAMAAFESQYLSIPHFCN